MTESFPQDEVVKPDEAFWRRPLTLDVKGFFSSLAKASLRATLQQWDEAAAEALDALAATGIARTPPQLAGVLLKRAMLRATLDLLRAYHRDFPEELPADSEKVCGDIEVEIAQASIPLNEDFLDRPREIAIISVFQNRLENWLAWRRIREHAPHAIAARLPSYFVYALHQELRENKIDYSPLILHIRTEVADAWRRERTWHAYELNFHRSLDEPLFGEGFGLRQIFLWPNAFYIRRPAKEQQRTGLSPGVVEPGTEGEMKSVKRVVVELKEALDHWLEQKDKDDAIRIVSGDPGAGKSSFVRMYALERLERGDRVLVVPLHLVNVQDDLALSIEAFCQLRDDCPTGLLAAESAEEQLLLVLDGLDELSKQGAIGATIAAQFVEEVIRTVRSRNATALRLRALISGRPIAVQNIADKFRRETQVLHLLPYIMEKSEREKLKQQRDGLYAGRTELLQVDLRHQWWQKYGLLKNRPYAGLPQELSGERLEDVTAQPLLNYLVALVYERRTIDFTQDVSRNEIYHDLLDSVYERDWDPAKSHKALGKLDRQDFRDLLEEMALTSWHDRERTTTVQAVRDRCQGTYLQDVLCSYEEQCSEGVAQLFTAFYFRKSGQVVGPEPTFELGVTRMSR